MKLGVIIDDYDIKQAIKDKGYFETVESLRIEAEEKTDADVLLICDKSISASEIGNYNIFDQGKIIFYLVSSERFSNMSEALIKSKGMIMVPPQMTSRQTADFIVSHLDQRRTRKNNLFTFFGADAKVGTTMIAQSTGEYLTRHGLKVVLVSLDGRSGETYLIHPVKYGLDDVKSKLSAKILSRQELMDLCIIDQTGLSHLSGCRNILMRRQYQPDEISYLLEMLELLFDVILVDAGSNIELGMTIAALHSTPNRFLVTTQQATVTDWYSKLKMQVLDKLGVSDFMTIVNKVIIDPALPHPVRIAEQADSTLLTTVGFSEYGWQAEMEKKTLLTLDGENMIGGIQEIGKIISLHVGAQWDDGKQEKGLMGKLKRMLRFKKTGGTDYDGSVQTR